jgi:EAL domain-containing protein (putative c-di-GMP-specific phosphodiesterase class I)
LRVLAEGVETAAEYEFLRANGCDEMQGHYLSAALPAAQFAALLGAQGTAEITGCGDGTAA